MLPSWCCCISSLAGASGCIASLFCLTTLLCAFLLQEFAYTMAAAYRTEQRRLLNFIRMADFIMCDTLHSILIQTMQEVLDMVQPAVMPTGASSPSRSNSQYSKDLTASTAGSNRTLDHFSSLLGSSRRQRQAAAVAGLQLVPVSALQITTSATGQSGGAARVPVFELDVLLSPDLQEVVLHPEPEQLQVGATAHVLCPLYCHLCCCLSGLCDNMLLTV
jgi:hypothetical protein